MALDQVANKLLYPVADGVMDAMESRVRRGVGGKPEQTVMEKLKYNAKPWNWRPLTGTLNHVMDAALMLPIKGAFNGAANVWRGASSAIPANWLDAIESGLQETFPEWQGAAGFRKYVGSKPYGYTPVGRAIEGAVSIRDAVRSGKGAGHVLSETWGAAKGTAGSFFTAPLAAGAYAIGQVAAGAVQAGAAIGRHAVISVPGIVEGGFHAAKRIGQAGSGLYGLISRELPHAGEHNTLFERLAGREVYPLVQEAVLAGSLGLSFAKGVFSGFQNVSIGRVDSELAPLAGLDDFGPAQLSGRVSTDMPLANYGADGDLVFALHRLRNGG